jgi:hypothetical protein
MFDPGHCRDCARETDLVDHCWRVQRDKHVFREAHRRAGRRRGAVYALWSADLGSCWPPSPSWQDDPPLEVIHDEAAGAL